ncbi:unnamed protein product [Nezara viridula]|uniref:Uncharacterized protein n=1 Tax=Nezara viridula TaxID=85310 RepID=A0A9P0MTY5_NEZVI|nr:unnamed protein product [Nezara viridula]
MTTFPLSVLVDPLKIEELFQKIENRKKLEQMLMDPRVIELSRQSPQSRQALAAVVRRLQEERERKRRIRSAEQKEEEPAAKWFNCINFLKHFSVPPKQSTRHLMKPPESTLRQKNKVSRSTPNLESTALPSLVTEESPTLFMTSQSMPTNIMPEMSVCIPNMSKEGALPCNLMDFCTSEKGRAMITSIINNTDIKRLLGLKSSIPTESHQLVHCIDCLNGSYLQSIQFYIPSKTSCQRFIVLRSRASGNSLPRLTFDGHCTHLKSVVSSATQTAYSGSCSHCSSYCNSTDSFSSYNNPPRGGLVQKIPYELSLCKKNYMIKASKSQSAMYTTDYSDCDCDNFSSPDELCSGKYLSRILTNAVAPKIDYLTTPDVLVTYSGKGNSSDGSSSSSCKVCKGNISTESFQREPHEIWTQKRLKTSCESCLNTFRTEYIRKSRYSTEYSKEITRLSNRSGSFDSLSSEESSQGISNGLREFGEDFYAQAKSILDGVGVDAQIEQFDRRNEIIMKDCSVYEERIIQEENCDVETKNIDCLNSDVKNVSSGELEQTDSNEKPTESVYESTAQSLAPIIEKNLSFSSEGKVRNITICEYTKTQLDGGLEPPENGSSKPQSAVPNRKQLLVDDLFSTTSSEEERKHAECVVTRLRKPRKRVRTKTGSTSAFSDSSSSSSLPQFRTFPRRMKAKAAPMETPTVPQQNLLQKISKQKSRKKNCAIM